MAASLAAIGTIVISDIAEARTTQEVLTSDEVPTAPKVTMKKVLAAPEPEIDPDEVKDLLLDLPMPKYGNFEGY